MKLYLKKICVKLAQLILCWLFLYSLLSWCTTHIEKAQVCPNISSFLFILFKSKFLLNGKLKWAC